MRKEEEKVIVATQRLGFTFWPRCGNFETEGQFLKRKIHYANTAKKFLTQYTLAKETYWELCKAMKAPVRECEDLFMQSSKPVKEVKQMLRGFGKNEDAKRVKEVYQFFNSVSPPSSIKSHKLKDAILEMQEKNAEYQQRLDAMEEMATLMRKWTMTYYFNKAFTEIPIDKNIIILAGGRKLSKAKVEELYGKLKCPDHCVEKDFMVMILPKDGNLGGYVEDVYKETERYFLPVNTITYL